jgi:CDP-paratose 2-epimerase
LSRVLVTGGAGFIGCNLADRLADLGHEVVVYDALVRPGVERNLLWLQKRHGDRIVPVVADTRDEARLDAALEGCEAVFHLAAQVAVTTSLVEPLADFEVNLQATVSLLELIRQRNARIPLIFASTNKVYGDLADVRLERKGECWLPVDAHLRSTGVNEARPLDFHTPYGCSKGAADQYVLDYARSFDVPTCVMRMSCIYGPRQMGTEDQGWVAHFLIQALHGERISIFGDGCQVRDILHVSDAVSAYLAAWTSIETVSGKAFNLGGGPRNAVSLRQLTAYIEDVVGRELDISFSDWRAGDQRYFVADTSAARRELGLSEPRDWREGVLGLAEWLQSEDIVMRVPADA